MLRAEVKAGRLHGDAVEAVLGAAGHRVTHRRGGPGGLTEREVEVLQLPPPAAPLPACSPLQHGLLPEAAFAPRDPA